jgi:hypothetical protein
VIKQIPIAARQKYKVLLSKLILPNINLTGIRAKFLKVGSPKIFHQFEPLTDIPDAICLRKIGSHRAKATTSGIRLKEIFFQLFQPTTKKTGMMKRET